MADVKRNEKDESKGHEILKETQDAAAKAKAEAEEKEQEAATLAGAHSTAGGNQPLP